MVESAKTHTILKNEALTKHSFILEKQCKARCKKMHIINTLAIMIKVELLEVFSLLYKSERFSVHRKSDTTVDKKILNCFHKACPFSISETLFSFSFLAGVYSNFLFMAEITTW